MKIKKKIDKDIRVRMNKTYPGIKGLINPLFERIWKKRTFRLATRINKTKIWGSRRIFLQRKPKQIQKLKSYLVNVYQSRRHKLKMHKIFRKRLAYSNLLNSDIYKTFQVKLNRLRIIGRREGKRKANRLLNIQPLGKALVFAGKRYQLNTHFNLKLKRLRKVLLRQRSTKKLFTHYNENAEIDKKNYNTFFKVLYPKAIPYHIKPRVKRKYTRRKNL